MRVIAGEKRHLLLKTLSDLSIRPTTDKIKETLFNMIHFELPGCKFLDLFAGSGAIGIEALSRGALLATFVDNNDKSIKVLMENLEHTGLTDRANVLRVDASNAIQNLNKNKVVYDFVFMDPPYDKNLYYDVFAVLSNSNIITTKTKIILETSIKDKVDNIEELGFKIYKIKEYKTNKHIFFIKNS